MESGKEGVLQLQGRHLLDEWSCHEEWQLAEDVWLVLPPLQHQHFPARPTNDIFYWDVVHTGFSVRGGYWPRARQDWIYNILTCNAIWKPTLRCALFRVAGQSTVDHKIIYIFVWHIFLIRLTNTPTVTLYQVFFNSSKGISQQAQSTRDFTYKCVPVRLEISGYIKSRSILSI